VVVQEDGLRDPVCAYYTKIEHDDAGGKNSLVV